MLYFTSRDEMIRALCRPGMRIAEVGVFLGSFGQVLASTLPDELVLIDTWEGVLPSGDADGNNVVTADLPKVYPMIVQHFSRWPWVKVRRMRSDECLATYPDEYFDIVYIDADHSYEGVKRDLNAARRKVKPGGWILGHDYDMNMLKAKNVYDFGVRQAVDEFCTQTGLKVGALGLDGCVSFGIQVPPSSRNEKGRRQGSPRS